MTRARRDTRSTLLRALAQLRRTVCVGGYSAVKPNFFPLEGSVLLRNRLTDRACLQPSLQGVFGQRSRKRRLPWYLLPK